MSVTQIIASANQLNKLYIHKPSSYHVWTKHARVYEIMENRLRRYPEFQDAGARS